MVVFTRDLDKALASLVKDIEKTVKGSKKGVSFVVHMDDDTKGSAEKLKAFAKANGLSKVALTTNKSGKKSPAGYKINDKVKYTILLYEKKKVVKNFALNKIDDASRKKIVAATQKLMKVTTVAAKT